VTAVAAGCGHAGEVAGSGVAGAPVGATGGGTEGGTEASTADEDEDGDGDVTVGDTGAQAGVEVVARPVGAGPFGAGPVGVGPVGVGPVGVGGIRCARKRQPPLAVGAEAGAAAERNRGRPWPHSATTEIGDVSSVSKVTWMRSGPRDCTVTAQPGAGWA
jgi:hypothetical protein